MDLKPITQKTEGRFTSLIKYRKIVLWKVIIMCAISWVAGFIWKSIVYTPNLTP